MRYVNIKRFVGACFVGHARLVQYNCATPEKQGVRHPQTNGKLERLHGEIQRKLPEFEAIMMRKSDPVDLFMEWYNHRRPHMSLGVDGENETPTHAFIRKMPPRGETVVDKQTGEEYHVK